MMTFLAYFANWKSADTSRRRIYNCEYCKQKGIIDKKHCFWEDERDDGKLLIDFKESVEEGQPLATSYDFFDEEDLYNKIYEISLGEGYERSTNFDIAKLHFPNVCLMSLCNVEHFKWLDIESMAKEYHVLPCPGALTDQPQVMIVMLAAILQGRAEYQSKYLEDMKAKGGNNG